MVRPPDQLRKIGFRKAGHIDDGDPMVTPPVSGGLHPRDIGQLDEPVRCNPCTETPPFRFTGLEIGEFPAAHRVDKKIVGLLIQRFGGSRNPATKRSQLRDVHGSWVFPSGTRTIGGPLARSARVRNRQCMAYTHIERPTTDRRSFGLGKAANAGPR
jgi:hypothetical protein